jgi:hypothetical protein
MAPKENIEAAQKLAEETRTQREAKRLISRAHRQKQETKYREQFAEAVYEYLSFAVKHEQLAHDIAKTVAEYATQEVVSKWDGQGNCPFKKRQY